MVFANMFQLKDKKLSENLYLFDLSEFVKKDEEVPPLEPLIEEPPTREQEF